MPDLFKSLANLIPRLPDTSNLQGLNPSTDAAALAAQANDPPWKKYAQSIIDSLGGAVKGQLGIDPTGEKSNSEYAANAGSQILGAGLPFLSLLKGAPVFHGTGQVFEAFDPTRYDKTDVLGHMTHFAEDSNYADAYAKGFMKHGAGFAQKSNIIAAHPDAKNVLDLVNPNYDDISQVVASMPTNVKADLIQKFKAYGRMSDISPEEKSKFFSGSILSYLDNENNSKRIPFDAIRYDDAGNIALAVPKDTPINTPWGTPLNKTSSTTQRAKSLEK